jgi:hypothetical protein
VQPRAFAKHKRRGAGQQPQRPRRDVDKKNRFQFPPLSQLPNTNAQIAT